MAGRKAPAQLADMLAFVEDFIPPHMLYALRDAEPLAEVARTGCLRASGDATTR